MNTSTISSSWSPKVYWYAHLAMALQTLLVAPGYTYGKWAAIAIPPLALLQLRYIGTLMCFMLFLLFQPRQDWQGIYRYAKNNRITLLSMAMVGVVLNQLTFIYGLKYTSPGSAALLFALLPLAVFFLAVTVTKTESFTLGKLASACIAVVGVSIVIIYSYKSASIGSNPLLGNLFIIGCVLCWAVYMAASRKFVQQFNPLLFITFLSGLGFLLFLPAGIPALIELDFSTIPFKAWLGLGYLTVFNSALSYVLVMYALKNLHASKVSIYSNAQPIFGILFSILIGMDELTLPFALGSLIALLGIYLLNKQK